MTRVHTPAPQRPDSRGSPPSPAAGKRWTAWRARLDVKYSPYLYIAPFFLLFAAFGLFPLAYTFFVSLHDWHMVGDREYTGFDNYAELLGDDRFWNATYNTLGIFIIATIPQLLAALAIAHVLNRKLRALTFFRMAIVVPSITSVAAIAIVFNQLYARDFGMVNYLIGLIGFEGINWQAHRWSSWFAIATIVDWRWIGYNAVIYLAAMQAIPRQLYEAAAIDGASQWRQFWHITVPMLRPTIIFTVIISTIFGLQLFTEPLLFGSGAEITGGSLRQFQTVTMYMFENAFGLFDYGYASTVAWMLFLLILIGSLINFFVVRRISSAE
ncbi:sugar ABC transporter permease [Haloechinothrix sp. LS1_15]|uniref:carbohydrate ABC transporter permease n=1 Tax=Haloechinothrix sp. LS1_15 TaxID=2652248 RepID=UPI00294B09E5|nr:sugar ABC transporter permease [Haloechinothrix sp. LS1_15]